MVQAILRANEILEMAIELEMQGIAYYETWIEQTKSRPAAVVFKHLLEQEKQHAEVFTRMKEDVSADRPLPEEYLDELRSYLASYVKGRVFPALSTEKKTDPTAHLNIHQTIELALELEKRSILFYSGLKPAIRPTEYATVDKIIGEEHEHIRRLLDLRSSLREVTE